MFHRLFTGFFLRPMCLLLALAYLCSALVVALPLLPRSDAPQPVSLISRAPKRQRNAVRLGYIDWDRSPPQWVALKEDTSKASQVLCIVSAYCLGYNEKTRKVQQVDMSTCPGKNKVTDYFRLFSAVITVREFDNRKRWFYDSFLWPASICLSGNGWNAEGRKIYCSHVISYAKQEGDHCFKLCSTQIS
ncbi:hypothetical protein F5878DRAFT_86504 [Lentinula raphanica]|uniref:Secreted protein n=1 Tax=Lentinula raphanica TaxID=153919 RepID=A0AA38PKX3_9AGAR|nr:hypothetical protein F5878DRAFT_86504 [Lentinula raphanica]